MRKFSNIGKRIIKTLPPSDRRIVNDVTKAINDVKGGDLSLPEQMVLLFSVLENIVCPADEAKGWQIDMFATLFQTDKKTFMDSLKSIDKLRELCYSIDVGGDQ